MMNGIKWIIIDVSPYDPKLIDRNNILTVGTTDPLTHCIYLSSALRGSFKKRVLAHELGHAACFSYKLIDQIHEYCYPEHWIDMEEFICNFVADYGAYIWELTNDITKVPGYLERLVS